MAETRYEIGLLNYHCDTYESAIDFLNNWGKHKPGQPVCVFYGSEDTEWRVLFAVGSSETDGNKYNILGEVAADDLNEKIQWFSLDEDGNIKTDGNTLRLVHDLNEEDNIESLASNNENVLFVKTGDGIGCIYHNGVLYASPYIDDKVLKEDLTHGETTYPAGTSLTAILTDILEKIGTENIKVSWDNIENIPTNVEDAFDCDTFMKKGNNLSDVEDKKIATKNLLEGLDGINNNTVLKFEDGIIKWGGAIIGWYDKTGGLLPNTEVKFTNITREEYEGLTTPDTSTLYFVYSGSGAGTTYELFIGPHSLKTNTYHIEEASEKPEGVEKRYVLKDSAGIQSGEAIDIPKDKFVTHAELKTVTEPDVPYEGAKVGDEYIDLEILNCADHIYIPLGDLDIPQSDWNEDNPESGAFIKNKPTKTSDFINDGEGDTPSDPFAKVSDLPTKTSDLINDGNGGLPLNPFVTADEVAQSDWDENNVESPAHILNRTHYDEGSTTETMESHFYDVNVEYDYNEGDTGILNAFEITDISEFLVGGTNNGTINISLIGQDYEDNPITINETVPFLHIGGEQVYYASIDLGDDIQNYVEYLYRHPGEYIFVGYEWGCALMVGGDLGYDDAFFMDNNITITIEKEIKNIKKLDVKYLPDGGVGYEDVTPLDTEGMTDFEVELQGGMLIVRGKYMPTPAGFNIEDYHGYIKMHYLNEATSPTFDYTTELDLDTIKEDSFYDGFYHISGMPVFGVNNDENPSEEYAEGPGVYIFTYWGMPDYNFEKSFEPHFHTSEIHQIDKKFIPKLTRDVVFKRTENGLLVPEFNPFDYIDNLNVETFDVEFLRNSKVIEQPFTNFSGGYNADGQGNPGYPRTKKAFLWFDDNLYSVGGDNNVNIYRWESDYTSKEVIVTLDSSHFTSTYAMTCDEDGNCIVVGQSTGVAIFNLYDDNPTVTYFDLDTNMLDLRDVAMIDIDHFAVLRNLTSRQGWAPCYVIYNENDEYIVKTTLNPQHCGNLGVIGNSFYLGVQNVLGLGYGFGIARYDVYDNAGTPVENPGWRLVARISSENSAHPITFGKFEDFVLDGLNGVYYACSGKGDGFMLSFDNGETWELWTGVWRCTGIREDGMALSEDGGFSLITGIDELGHTLETIDLGELNLHEYYRYNGITFFVQNNFDLDYSVAKNANYSHRSALFEIEVLTTFNLTNGIHCTYFGGQPIPKRGGGLIVEKEETPSYFLFNSEIVTITENNEESLAYRITKVPDYETVDKQKYTTLIILEGDRQIWECTEMDSQYNGWVVKMEVLFSTPVILLATDEEMDMICQ